MIFLRHLLRCFAFQSHIKALRQRYQSNKEALAVMYNMQEWRYFAYTVLHAFVSLPHDVVVSTPWNFMNVFITFLNVFF